MHFSDKICVLFWQMLSIDKSNISTANVITYYLGGEPQFPPDSILISIFVIFTGIYRKSYKFSLSKMRYEINS